jgi:hypothetical protein
VVVEAATAHPGHLCKAAAVIVQKAAQQMDQAVNKARDKTLSVDQILP